MNKKTKAQALSFALDQLQLSLTSVLPFFGCCHSTANLCRPWCSGYTHPCDFQLSQGSYHSFKFCFLKLFCSLGEVRVFPWEERSAWVTHKKTEALEVVWNVLQVQIEAVLGLTWYEDENASESEC